MGHYIVVKPTPNPNPNYRPLMGHIDKSNYIKAEPYYVIMKDNQYVAINCGYPYLTNEIKFAEKFWSVSHYIENTDYRKMFPEFFTDSKLAKVETFYKLTKVRTDESNES